MTREDRRWRLRPVRFVLAPALTLALAGAASGVENHCRVGPGHGIILPTFGGPCSPAVLCLSFGTTVEDGFAWQYGGVQPPIYGAFAEGWDFRGQARICALELLLTGSGGTCRAADLYIWADDGGKPGQVLSVLPGFNPCPTATWPSVNVEDIVVPEATVSGLAWFGLRSDFSEQPCGYYIAADMDSSGGHPMTCIAPGLGYPTGWNDVSVVWGPTGALGIGAWVVDWTPVEGPSWGVIKQIFRQP